ncbi:MAG: N-6 DNA methylase [Ruminococcus sp.]|nr:N-6 DNA methylase [Ruminococcus sp.]
MGYKTYLNVLHFWEGSSYNARTAESYFDWRVVAAYFEGMRLLGELRDTAKPLPSVEGQMDLISDSAEEKSSAFVFSQEIIDAVLTEKASGVEEGKFRIYEQFQKSLSRDENIRFLKNEYGIGGSYPVLTGTGIDEDHNGKGITLMRGFGDNAPKILLKWNQVERRISELIKMGRYLNDREREFYPLWLTKQEQLRAETAEEIRRRKEERRRQMEMETAPEERNTQYEYQYHLGDTVYIGSTGYEILSIDEDRVMLFDPKFPLFNKEMPRAEFDERVQENPLNNSLRVAEKTPPQPESVKTASDVPVSSVDRYFELKAQNPESILLFRIGDFYEIMGDDAVTVAQALELTLTSRRRNNTERVPMVGFPAAVIDSYTNMLLDRGWNVAVTKETGEVINIVTDRDERPVNSYPIARIDYYKPDGSFDDSIEFTNPARLGSAIINESPYEIMSLYLYRDKDGKVVPHSYVDDLPHPLRSFEIVDSPIIGQSELIIMLERAKDLINEFCHREFHHSADFDDLSKVNLAYTETEDGSHEIQSYADLEDFSIVTTVDEQVVRTESFDSLQELVDQGLQEMEFGDLVYVSEEELAPFYEGIDEQKEVDSDEIKLRSVVIDLRPDDVIAAEHIGRTVQIDDRDFQIEDVSERGEVLLRDLTFERETGYPVFRREKADLVRRAIAGQPVQTQNADELIPAWEQQPRTKAQTFDLHPEIPMSQRHTFDLASSEVETVGKKERFNRNINAIRTLKSCQKDNRFATPEEQVILSKYVGWGGIPEAFDENNPSWESEYNVLLNGLTEEEYASARASTLTAFYTPPAVISAIYKVMENMGFQRGNILEPSCGIGNFIGMLPASMSESRVFGVEIDTVSAGIAQQLYQKSSIAAQPYEQAEIPDSFFDAVVGNVPFGDLRVSDKRYDKHHFLIHDYFFAKSLDKLRPGGVMALVTSRGTMDKENPAVRRYIAQRADLLGAIRLPNNTFRGNAGTDAVSDILILQKRDRIIDIEPSWVHLGTDENGITMNSYFIEHPEMILGEMKLVSGRFGMTPDCVPYEGTDLKELLDEAVANIHGEIVDYELDGDIEEDNSIPADPDVRNFSFTILDGEIYYRENSRMTPIDISETAKNRIKGMIPIRDCVRTLLEMQLNDYPDTEVQAEQRRLNALYDGFTKKYGLINSRANTAAFSMDSSYSLISALEILDEEGNLERKADIFTKRTIKPHTPTVSVDTASEALAVSMEEKARVDMGYMCELSGLSEEKICEDLKGVIFLNPLYGNGSEGSSQKYLTSDEYLSGNVREKLETARRSAQLYPQDYAVNVEMLEKVQPEDLKASEISVRLGATWLPIEDVQDFIYDLLDTPYYARWKIKVHFSPLTGEWNIENKTYDRTNVKAYSTFGTDRINAYQIIEQTLNLKDVRIYDYIEEPNGKRKPVLNKKETALALAKQENVKQSFQDWIWSDPSRRERLCRLYNDKFNTYRPREYDGSHISFVGMNPEITLREHQRNAVAHILYGGNTLLAHAVGAGKTYEMAAAAMESKRLGLCNKSLFVVPNHLTEQWAAEFLQLYPAANILVSTKKDFEKKNRRRFCGRIATGDYDAVIIGHSQFEKIPISIERQKAMLKRQLEDITDGILELSENHGDKFTVKQLEKSRRAIRTKLEKLNAQDNKDDVVTFEELGVDRLFVDESHYYKNLYLYTKMRNVGGIAQTEAQKSSDLFMKCRYLDELTGSRGTVFATGTPISNSMVELYTIQRYLQYETLVKNDLQHFDAWASTFGETVSAVELTPEGTGYRSKVRFARFYNLPELMSMFRQVADIQTSDMLELPVPKANYHNIAVKPSQVQKDMVAGLAKRAEKIRNRMVDASVDNMLNITNDGRKLALDQRLLNPILPDFEGSKVNACVQNVYDIWQKTAEKQLTQLLFCDLSTPKKNEFSVYTDIREKLIARGIPENEIAFIHDAKTEAQKLDLFRKVRRGEVRILLGSTQKMGAGTNAQNKLVSMHDLDCPWRPSDMEQRSGRIIRQGNENDEVDIYRYVTEETFDAYLYQLVESKQKFCSQIMTSKTPVRSAEDVDLMALSYAEIKMLATGNPFIKEKMELDIDVQKLQLIKAGFLSEKYDLEDKILKYYPQKISSVKGAIEGLKENIRIVQQYPKSINDAFVGMEIKGVFYDDKAKAGQAILDACKAMQSSDAFHLGSYRGFDMELYFDTISRHYEIRLKGRISHDVELGTDVFGNITRLDNVLEGLEKRLELMESDLENIQKQYETAKVEVKKPFPQEEELRTKTNRLNELNALLDMDRKDDAELFSGETAEVEDDISDRSRSSRDER